MRREHWGKDNACFFSRSNRADKQEMGRKVESEGNTIMVANPQRWPMNVEDYLKLDDNNTDVRYEYLDGQIYAMAGGTADHSRLAINTIVALDAQLSSGTCHVFNSDMRVQLSEERYVYPDVSISCDSADAQGDSKTLHFPKMIIEILSPSTELRDRTSKFASYRARPTIQEYALVNYTHQYVEIYRRNGKRWSYQSYELDEDVEFTSLNLSIPISEIYRLTNIPTHAPKPEDE